MKSIVFSTMLGHALIPSLFWVKDWKEWLICFSQLWFRIKFISWQQDIAILNNECNSLQFPVHSTFFCCINHFAFNCRRMTTAFGYLSCLSGKSSFPAWLFFAITVLQSKLYFFINQFRRRHQLLSCWLKSLWFSILCDFCNRFRLFLVSQQIFWSFMSFDSVFVSPEIVVFSGRTQRLHQTDCFFIISFEPEFNRAFDLRL